MAVLAVGLAAFPPQAFAQRSLPIVRDAEIEGLLLDYARPVFKAAGLGGKGIRIVLVNSRSFNAFVDGRRIFINTGALLTALTPNEIVGVIAHESGHIAGGHQQRLRDQIARAKALAVVGVLAGIGAAAASGSAETAGGALTVAPGIARRALLSYRRSEEITADRAAIEYLNATGQSAKGMLVTFRRFSSQLALGDGRLNPYEISHPLPRERIALLETLAKKSRYFARKDPPALQRRHDMIRGKIAAYTGGASAVGRAFREDPDNPGARYGLAIAAFLRGDIRQSLAAIDKLISQDKKNPYLHEMKGEILLKNRQPGKAAAAFRRAVGLDRFRSGVIRGRLGFAYLSTGEKARMKEAIRQLRAAISASPDNYDAYTFLSRAYARAGDVANAELAQAEGHFRAGNIPEAKRFAVRAAQKMRRDTPGWRRANDIVKYRDRNP